jgi:hypothetical protein
MPTEPAATAPVLSHPAPPGLAVTEAPALPTAIRRVLPSIYSLADEDVIHRPEVFLALADRINAAMSDLSELETRADPAEVVKFLALTAERRGFALPSPSLLAMDARAVAAEMPADLLPLACGRLWARFAYRRLPEPSDFLAAVQLELAERYEFAARIKTVALKIQHARWLDEQRRKADARHAAARERDRQQESGRYISPKASFMPEPAAPKLDLQSVGDDYREVDDVWHRQQPRKRRNPQELYKSATTQPKVVSGGDRQACCSSSHIAYSDEDEADDQKVRDEKIGSIRGSCHYSAFNMPVHQDTETADRDTKVVHSAHPCIVPADRVPKVERLALCYRPSPVSLERLCQGDRI